MPEKCYVLGALITSGLLFCLVPERIHKIRDQLARFSDRKRNASKELVVSVVGDEPAALFISNYFMQRAAIKLILVLWLLGLTILILLSYIWPSLINQETLSLYDARMIITGFGILSAVILFAVMAQGITQGLIGLDSSVAFTPAPIGKTEVIIVNLIRKDNIFKLRHSQIYETEETIGVVIEWLKCVLGNHRT